MKRVLGDSWVKPPCHLDGDTGAPEGNGLPQGHTMNLVSSLASARQAFTPASSATPPRLAHPPALGSESSTQGLWGLPHHG